jgi:hypothetical protein
MMRRNDARAARREPSRRWSDALSDCTASGRIVIPAKAGIHNLINALLDARVRRHDKKNCAG